LLLRTRDLLGLPPRQPLQVMRTAWVADWARWKPEPTKAASRPPRAESPSARLARRSGHSRRGAEGTTRTEGDEVEEDSKGAPGFV